LKNGTSNFKKVGKTYGNSPYLLSLAPEKGRFLSISARSPLKCPRMNSLPLPV